MNNETGSEIFRRFYTQAPPHEIDPVGNIGQAFAFAFGFDFLLAALDSKSRSTDGTSY